MPHVDTIVDTTLTIRFNHQEIVAMLRERKLIPADWKQFSMKVKPEGESSLCIEVCETRKLMPDTNAR